MLARALRSLPLAISIALSVLLVVPASAEANPFKDFGRAVKDTGRQGGRAVKDGSKQVGRAVKGAFKGGAGAKSGAKAGGRRGKGGGGRKHGGRHHRR
jgi:hypothetical protein